MHAGNGLGAAGAASLALALAKMTTQLLSLNIGCASHAMVATHPPLKGWRGTRDNCATGTERRPRAIPDALRGAPRVDEADVTALLAGSRPAGRRAAADRLSDGLPLLQSTGLALPAQSHWRGRWR